MISSVGTSGPPAISAFLVSPSSSACKRRSPSFGLRLGRLEVAVELEEVELLLLLLLLSVLVIQLPLPEGAPSLLLLLVVVVAVAGGEGLLSLSKLIPPQVGL